MQATWKLCQTKQNLVYNNNNKTYELKSCHVEITDSSQGHQN